MGHEDRSIRYAARVALEHQDPEVWQGRVLNEKLRERLVNGAIVLARVGDKSNQAPLLDALNGVSVDGLSSHQLIRLLRAYGMIMMRLGSPTPEQTKALIKRLDPLFPSEDRYLNAELCKLLVYLQAPATAVKGVSLLSSAPSQEEQIDYAMSLRHLQSGWTPELRKTYFTWFNRAKSYRGGASFRKFVDFIQTEALENVSETERPSLNDLLARATPPPSPLAAIGARRFVKDWIGRTRPLGRARLTESRL